MVECTVEEGVLQMAGYMDRCDAETGHLVIFDRDEGKEWEEDISARGECRRDADHRMDDMCRCWHSRLNGKGCSMNPVNPSEHALPVL